MLKKLKQIYHHHLARPIYSLLRPWQPIFGLKKRTFFDKFKVKTKDGVSFWLYNNAFFWETEMFWAGFENFDYENETRAIWCHLAQKSKVIFDIGANTGWFSVMAKAYNPNAEVHAFEPQPNVFKVLQQNMRINGFDVNCHQMALADKKGELPFYNTGNETFTSFNTTHGSLNKEWRTEKQSFISVQVDTMDNFITAHKIEEIDLIKIDVETYEPEVLTGYEKYIKVHRPIIILEIQDSTISERVQKIVKDKSYIFFQIDEKSGLVSIEEFGLNSKIKDRNYLICPNEKLGLLKKFLPV